MSTPVAQTWSRISAWLRTNAPRTAELVRPPADPVGIDGVERAFGRDLPGALRELWLCADGTTERVELFPPFYAFLSVAEARAEWEFQTGFDDGGCCGDDGSHAYAAGQEVFGCCRALFPFARDLGGGTLVVDQRDGPMRGSIAEYDAECGLMNGGRRDLGSLLDATAAALESPPVHVSGLALYPEPSANGGIGVFGWIDPVED